jgi:hypothetical protein
MADSRFGKDMDDWGDPGSIEALLHVDAQLLDDPLGYTSWEASGPLATLLQAATADDATYDAEAEAAAVAGFNLARALDDENFYARTSHLSRKPGRAVSRAALAGVLAAGVLAATGGLAAAHTSVARVISDIAHGLNSNGAPHPESHRPAQPPAGSASESAESVTSTVSSTVPTPAGGCDPGVAGSASNSTSSNSTSSNSACGVVSHVSVTTGLPATIHRHGAKGRTALGGAPGATAPPNSSTTVPSNPGSGGRGGAKPGSGSGPGGVWRTGSGTGRGSGTGTGNGTGPGPGGHHHHHHRHHHHHHTTNSSPTSTDG